MLLKFCWLPPHHLSSYSLAMDAPQISLHMGFLLSHFPLLLPLGPMTLFCSLSPSAPLPLPLQGWHSCKERIGHNKDSGLLQAERTGRWQEKKEPRSPWQGGPHEGLMPLAKESPAQVYLAAEAVWETSLGPQGPRISSEVPYRQGPEGEIVNCEQPPFRGSWDQSWIPGHEQPHKSLWACHWVAHLHMVPQLIERLLPLGRM